MKITSSSDSRLPLYQRLSDEWLAKIASGEWQPGQAIPTEAELTQQYGVAVGTVRKAIDCLVNEGLLERSQGRGTFVRRPQFDASFFRFFRQLPSTGEQGIPESHILSNRVETPSATVRHALELEEHEEVVHLKRLRTIRNGHRFYEEIWLPAKAFYRLAELQPDEFDQLLYPFYEAQCGQIIASAQETLSISTAQEEVAERLQLAEGTPTVLVERVARGYNRKPLEYRIAQGPTQGFRYQIDIN